MDKYEAECKKRKEENHTFLTGFTRYLENKNLSKKTIDKHVQNIDFYINTFLLYEKPQEAAEGVSQLDWIIHGPRLPQISVCGEEVVVLHYDELQAGRCGEIRPARRVKKMRLIYKCANEKLSI